MKSGNYKRNAQKIKGSNEAMSPRSRVEMHAGKKAKAQNSQRLDIIRRNMLSSRKDNH
jgi:hypothetical protein